MSPKNGEPTTGRTKEDWELNPEEIRQQDFDAMTKMTDKLESACNIEIPNPNPKVNAPIRDKNAIESVLHAHADIIHEIGTKMWGGPKRVVSENDHFDIAADKLIRAYSGTTEAEKLLMALNRAKFILKNLADIFE